MKKRRGMQMTALAVLACLTQMHAPAANVGFSKLSVPDGSNPKIEVGVWYPTDETPKSTQIGIFTETVAADAKVKGNDLPMVLISHGNGGDYTSHIDTALALAQAGFVAAAPTHTGDNIHDQSRATDLADRPRQLYVVMNFMINQWERHVVDPRRIGAFGFSSGGFTVLAAAGGKPDMQLVIQHCMTHPDFFDCRVIAAHGNQGEIAMAGSPASMGNIRIRALVVAAPAIGFAFAHGLKNMTIPVQL